MNATLPNNSAGSCSPAQLDAHPGQPPLDARELGELMRSVAEVTDRLQATHATLQNQVAQLQSELAEANAQLRRSRSLAALGEMAAGIAHEIRNPLGSIQLFVQMLAEDVAHKPEQFQICRKISRAVDGLDAIVRDVLQFSRQQKPASEPCDPVTLLSNAIEACQSLIEAGAVDVIWGESDSCSGDSFLEADSHLITQALSNVIRNAIEAMVESDSPSRRLTLGIALRRVRNPDGVRSQRIAFIVDDTGPGIPMSIVERMFNPFFTTRKTGTGLGLAIVHRIVDAHGGEVIVGRAPGTGTGTGTGSGARVELRLPMQASRARSAHSDCEIQTIPGLRAGQPMESTA